MASSKNGSREPGADPGYSERGSENLKKGICSVSLEIIGICIVKHQHYTLWAYSMFKQISNQVSIWNS